MASVAEKFAPFPLSIINPADSGYVTATTKKKYSGDFAKALAIFALVHIIRCKRSLDTDAVSICRSALSFGEAFSVSSGQTRLVWKTIASMSP